MAKKSILTLLTLAKIILAKPGYLKTPCEVWSFNGQYVKDYDPHIQSNLFNYT